MRLFITIVVCLFFTQLNARPYHGEIQEFSQPDGSKVEVKLYGNEYYMRGEGLDGYTVVRGADGWIYYAQLSTDQSKLKPSSIRYKGHSAVVGSLRTHLTMAQHLDISQEARLDVVKANEKVLGDPKELYSNGLESRGTLDIDTLQGHVIGLTILIDFPDMPAVVPVGEVDDFMNKMDYKGYGNNGSVRTFYKETSGGLLDYTNQVFGYYHATQTFKYYDSLPYAEGAQTLLREALQWIDDQGFDFSTLTTNKDKSIKAINLMYTGNPPNWAQGMWFHASWMGDFQADGVHSGPYNTSPANGPLELGTVCHENGHMIGRWPDTYKYDDKSGPDGIGAFDLMCGGGSGTNPVPMNPYFWSRVGWGKIVDVTDFNGLVRDTANSLTIYKYTNKLNPADYFMFQARRKVGRSASIPDDGITIWHIDENGNQQTNHVETALVHANNDINSHGRACFKETFRNEFTPNTIPNSDFYNNKKSKLWMWNISKVQPVMTYILGLGAYAPYILGEYVEWQNDDNGNGYLDVGEQFEVKLNISNLTVVQSDSVLVSAKATGDNATKITIDQPKVTIPVVNGNETLPQYFTVHIKPSMSTGATFTIEFTIQDSLHTQKIVQNFTVGKVITMDKKSTLTDCGFIYMDPGAEANYPDDKYLTQTIFPADPTKVLKIKFSEFNLEESNGCEKDFFEVLDGDLIDGISKGTYCGSNRPPVIIATNDKGALSFVFYSDLSVNNKGWKAEITCENRLGVKANEIPNVRLYPNPTDGNLFLAVPKGAQYTVTLFDVQGKKLVTKQFNSELFSLNMDQLPSGVYIVRINTADKSMTRQVILNN